MSYAEELQQQMQEKKRKDEAAKNKIKEEDMIREQKIQDEIQKELQIKQIIVGALE